MLALGPTVEYVHESDGIGGRTPAALDETREAAQQEGASRRIVAALGDVLTFDNDISRVRRFDVVDAFRQNGRFLFGVSDPGHRAREIERPYDGLLYAEGQSPTEAGAFSIVRMATWVRKGAPKYEGRTLVELMKASVFTEVAGSDAEDLDFGIPVGRLTVTKAFGGRNETIYGHGLDLARVADLDVPEDLRTVLDTATQSWHETELTQEQTRQWQIKLAGE